MCPLSITWHKAGFQQTLTGDSGKGFMRIKGKTVNKTKQKVKHAPKLVQCGVNIVKKLCLPISINSSLYVFEAETEILPAVV